MNARVLLAFSLVLGLLPGLQAASSYEQDLSRYQKEIKTAQSEVSSLREKIRRKEEEKSRYHTQEKGIRNELSKLESDLSRKESELDRLDQDIREAEHERKMIERELFLTRLAHDSSRDALAMGLRHYYKRYHGAAPDFDQEVQAVYDRSQILTVQKGLETVEQQKEKASLTHEQWKKTQAKLAAVQSQLRRQKEAQTLMRRQKDDLYHQVHGRRIEAEKEIGQLQEASKSLESLLSRLEGRKQETLEAKRAGELARRALVKKKGILPWPVSGSLVSRFGKHKHPELNTLVINNGIRIQTVSGSPVRAVDKGRVVYAGEFRAYGLMVVIEHSSGIHSIYGNLSRIQVAQDQLIAAYTPVGASSDNLYFEFRQGNEPQDPLVWLSPKPSSITAKASR